MSEETFLQRLGRVMGLSQPLPPALSNREALRRSGVMLDDFRMPNDAPYREDQPGMQQQIEQQLQNRPMIGPEIDPRMAPPLRSLLGIIPPNDRAVVSPDELPTSQRYQSYRYRA